MSKEYHVYRYINSEGDVIYVGQTARPLKNRVSEHKSEKLTNEMRRIEYIDLPNEAQMNQYEEYYINYYKPKYNIASVYDGIPIPLPEYEWKVFYSRNDFDSNDKYNQFVLDKIFDKLNNELFNGEINAFVSVTQNSNAQRFWVDNKKLYSFNGCLKYKITVSDDAVIIGDEIVVVSMLVQMILIYANNNSIHATSNNMRYKNKKFVELCKKYGIVVERSKRYGFEPVCLSDDICQLVSEFGFKNCDIFSSMKNYSKGDKYIKSHSIRYQCQKCRSIVRSTRPVNVICGDCNIRMITND